MKLRQPLHKATRCQFQQEHILADEDSDYIKSSSYHEEDFFIKKEDYIEKSIKINQIAIHTNLNTRFVCRLQSTKSS